MIFRSNLSRLKKKFYWDFIAIIHVILIWRKLILEYWVPNQKWKESVYQHLYALLQWSSIVCLMHIFCSFQIDCDAIVRGYHISHNAVYVANAIIWEKYSFLLIDILMMNHFYCSFIAFHQLLLMFITFSILSY